MAFFYVIKSHGGELWYGVENLAIWPKGSWVQSVGLALQFFGREDVENFMGLMGFKKDTWLDGVIEKIKAQEE